MYGLALCAGVGGLELGVKLALPTLRTVGYVERDAYAAATLVARMADSALDRAPVWDDIATFDGSAWRGCVDLITAGYPCQPFSAAGLRLGDSDPRHLWPHVRRILDDTSAPYLFCENVDRHLPNGFDLVAADLQDMGYRVAAGLYTAAELGAPHRRRRLFFLAANASCYDLWEQCRGSQWSSGQGSLVPALSGSPGIRDTHGLHRQGRTSAELQEQARSAPGCGWWAAEPELGRVADGVAYRMDRLRAIGNGVVPQVAARAFTDLVESLHG